VGEEHARRIIRQRKENLCSLSRVRIAEGKKGRPIREQGGKRSAALIKIPPNWLNDARKASRRCPTRDHCSAKLGNR